MKLSKYKNMVKQFGLSYTLKEIRYRFLLKLEKFSYSKRDRETFKYIKKYYNNTNNYSEYYKPLKENLQSCIWTLWLQGIDNAPPIVKACINSIKKYSGGYEVIVLTEDTIHDYVTFPDFIIQKYKSGIIKSTHFSDLLRTLLLINYGGIWMDATVFLTKPIPQNIISSDFFMFQSQLLKSEISPGSSWFISTQKNSPILIKVFELLLNYWKKHNYLIHYFLFHITVGLIINCDNEAKTIWQNMFYKNNSDPHFLQLKKLFCPFNQKMKDYIWDLSFVHKLTYKFSRNSPTELSGTFYRYILES